MSTSFFCGRLFRIFALLLLLLPLFVNAQENIAPVVEGEPMLISDTGATSTAEAAVMANINLSDALILSQDDSKLTLSFSLTNQGEKPQYDINYGFEVIRDTATGQSKVDSFTAKETLTLDAGESVTKAATYSLVNLPPGTYSLWIVAQTAGGVMLGLGNAGEFTVVTSTGVEIKADSCYLTIPSSSANTTYNLRQGVDVAADEDLTINCVVINHGITDRTVITQLETFKRSIRGDKVDFVDGAPVRISLKSKEEKLISVIITKPAAPQSYDVSLALLDSTTNQIVSNQVVAHYVLAGISATIQTVNFDKPDYKAGEEMSLDLVWTPAADGFEESRLGGTEIEGNFTASVSVIDGNGQVCVPAFSSILTERTQTLKAVSAITCAYPAATVTLIGPDGATLDTRNITSPTPVVEENSAPYSAGDNDMMIVTIIFLALSLVTVFLAMSRHKKVNIAQASKLLIITAVAISSVFVAGVEKVEAVTWGPDLWCDGTGSCFADAAITFTVNSNKNTYAPGENIVLSSFIQNAYCANSAKEYWMTASLQSQNISIANQIAVAGGTTDYRSGVLVAPMVPGVYTINLVGTAWVNSGYVDTPRTITINVSAPIATIVGATCLAGIQVGQSTCQGTLSWNIVSASSPNVYNLSTSNLYSTNALGNAEPITLGYGNNTIAARTGVSNIQTTSIVAACTPGSTWVSGVCANSALAPLKISCPYTNSPSRAVVDFTSGGYLTSDGNQAASRTGAHIASIPAGNYNVRLVAWDGGSTRDSNIGQYREIMSVSLLDSTNATLAKTNATVDLLDGVNEDTKDIQVNTSWTIPAGVTAVRAENAAYPDTSSSNSFFPICAVFESISPSYTLNPTTCSIAAMSGTCPADVSWSITGAVNPRVTLNGNLYSTDVSGSNKPTNLNYGINTFTLWDGPTSLELKTVVTSCVVGVWNPALNICDTNSISVIPPAPIINLSVSDKDIIRSGETANVDIIVTAPYSTKCTVTGVNNSPVVYTFNGSDTRSLSTGPLTSAQIVSVTCEPRPAISGVASASANVRINVVPIIIEI